MRILQIMDTLKENKKIRILYIMNHAETGGSALAFKELVCGVNEEEDIYPVAITGRYNQLNSFFTLRGIDNYHAPFKNFISSYHAPAILFSNLLRTRHYVGNKIALNKIEKEIDMSNIDLIHTNLDRIDIGMLLSEKYNIPHVWHLREHLGTDFKVMSLKKNFVNYMMRSNSEYIAVSNSVKNTWVKRGIPENKIHVIYDGINVDDIRKKEDFSNKEKLNIVFMGGYYPNKGQITFLKLFNTLPLNIKNKICVYFYGNGEKKYQKKLQNFINKKKLNNQVYVNNYRDDIYKILPKFDVGVNFSNDEGFGRVTVEYMAAGLTVIASNSGANKELILPNENGYLIDANNKEETFLKSISCAINSKTRKRIGKNNIARASKFSNTENINKIVELYKRLLSK